MKRYFLLLITLLQLNIYAIETILDISSESITIHHYNEREYIDAGYVINDNFTSGLEVYSETQDTKITIDGKTYRTESIKLNNLPEGKYYLEISARGYETYRSFINIYSEKRTVVFITLAREYGYLDIVTNTENRELYLNGFHILGNEPIPTGLYNLQVKSFGYEEENRVITISDGFITREFFELIEAPFKLEKLQLDKRFINPFAEERFAKLLITISVNGPGSGLLEILDSNGELISTIDLTFSDWKTKIFIDRADYLPVDDGYYSVNLSSEDQELQENITIDSKLKIKMANSTTSSNGLLYSSTAEINEIATHQSSFSLLYNSTTNQLLFPISYKYNLNRNVEMLVGFQFSLKHNNNDMLFKTYASIKTVKQWGKLSTALNLQYMFTESERVSYITLQTPLTYGSNTIYVNLCPSYVINFSMNQEISGSFGLFYDNQSLRMGLSFNIDQDIQYDTGYEIWKLLPDSQTYMGVNISYNWDSSITVGFGITNIY